MRDVMHETLHWIGTNPGTLIALVALLLSAYTLWRQRPRIRVSLSLNVVGQAQPGGAVTNTHYPLIEVASVRGTAGIDHITLTPTEGVASGGYGYTVVNLLTEYGYAPQPDPKDIDPHNPWGMRRVLTEGETASWTCKAVAQPDILVTPTRIIARVHLTSGKTVTSNEIYYPPKRPDSAPH